MFQPSADFSGELQDVTLVLLHGWASYPSYMRHIKAHFEGKFKEVIVPPWSEYCLIDKYAKEPVPRTPRSTSNKAKRLSCAKIVVEGFVKGDNSDNLNEKAYNQNKDNVASRSVESAQNEKDSGGVESVGTISKFSDKFTATFLATLDSNQHGDEKDEVSNEYKSESISKESDEGSITAKNFGLTTSTSEGEECTKVLGLTDVNPNVEGEDDKTAKINHESDNSGTSDKDAEGQIENEGNGHSGTSTPFPKRLERQVAFSVAEAFSACIDRLKEIIGNRKVIILGWSLGSYPATLLALDDEVDVQGVIFLDGTVAMTEEQRLIAEKLADMLEPHINARDEAAIRDILQPMMQQYFFSCFTEPSSLSIVDIMHKVVSNASEGSMLRHAVVYCGSLRCVAPQTLQLLSERCPVHAMFCGQTQLNMSLAEKMFNGNIHRLEGRSGHYFLLTCPEKTNDMLSTIFDDIGASIQELRFIPMATALSPRQPAIERVDIQDAEVRFIDAAAKVGDMVGYECLRRPLSVAVLIDNDFDTLSVFGPTNLIQMCEAHGKMAEVTYLCYKQDVPDDNIEETILSSVTLSDKTGCTRIKVEAVHIIGDRIYANLASSTIYDVLYVPNGFTNAHAKNLKGFCSYVRDISIHSRLIASIGDGNRILAAAGVLDGKIVKCSKADRRELEKLFRNVRWHDDGRIVADGCVISCSGIAAGLDVSLEIMSKIFGEEIARSIAKEAEYDWDPFYTLPGIGSKLASIL